MKRTLSIILVCFVLLTTFVFPACALETTNEYNEEVVYELTAVCGLKGDKYDENEKFSVAVVPDENSPEFEFPLVDVTANKKGSFGSISIEKPGVYNYTVSQEAGKNKKITYDETNFMVTVNVTTNDEGLITATYIIENLTTGEKVDAVEFINIHETEVPKTGDSKTLIAWGVPLGLLVLSLAVVFVSYVKLSKKEKEREEKVDESKE